MEQTLLLNASYEPLKIVDWQKAVTLWCQQKVEVISVYDREIRGVSISFKLPSVIRLLRYITVKPPVPIIGETNCSRVSRGSAVPARLKTYCVNPLQSNPRGSDPPFL